jgi:hypothetical protein
MSRTVYHFVPTSSTTGKVEEDTTTDKARIVSVKSLESIFILFSVLGGIAEIGVEPVHVWLEGKGHAFLYFYTLQ